MTNKAIQTAKEWSLKAYANTAGQIVVTNKSGNTVARIEKDGSASYKAAGYDKSIAEIASAYAAPIANTGNSAGFAGTDKKTLDNISRFGYDAIEM
jgi:hypothetical protein